jgi:hypothetical protein
MRNKKHWNLPDFFNSSPICPHNFSYQTLSLYFLFDMSYNSSHLRTSSINFSPISEDKNRKHSLEANTRSLVEETYRLFILSESNRFRQVRTRSVTSNILAQQRRRNGTDTWRRLSCQCEHLRLITHEKILLNGDVPRRKGNVMYRGADKSLALPGRKQATATEDFNVHISYLQS